jgi:hypothetical protein
VLRKWSGIWGISARIVRIVDRSGGAQIEIPVLAEFGLACLQ